MRKVVSKRERAKKLVAGSKSMGIRRHLLIVERTCPYIFFLSFCDSFEIHLKKVNIYSPKCHNFCPKNRFPFILPLIFFATKSQFLSPCSSPSPYKRRHEIQIYFSGTKKGFRSCLQRSGPNFR